MVSSRPGTLNIPFSCHSSVRHMCSISSSGAWIHRGCRKTQIVIANELRPLLACYTMAQSFVTQEPTIGGSSGRGGLPVQYVLQAPNLAKLEDVIPEFMRRARKHPALGVVDIDLQFTKPELVLDIDRDKAYDLGISVREIAQTLQIFFSEQRVGYFICDGKQYFVIAQAEPSQCRSPQDITNMRVRASTGEMIPLASLVSMREESLPPQLLRYNRYSSATISASTSQGYTLGDGIAANLLDESFLLHLRVLPPTLWKALKTCCWFLFLRSYLSYPCRAV